MHFAVIRDRNEVGLQYNNSDADFTEVYYLT